MKIVLNQDEFDEAIQLYLAVRGYALAGGDYIVRLKPFEVDFSSVRQTDGKYEHIVRYIQDK